LRVEFTSKQDVHLSIEFTKLYGLLNDQESSDSFTIDQLKHRSYFPLVGVITDHINSSFPHNHPLQTIKIQIPVRKIICL